MSLNYMKTVLLLGVMTAIFVGMGALIGGQTGMVVAFAVALAMNVFSLWYSDKLVLRMHNAQEANEQAAPGLYGIVRGLAARADLPMPRVYVMSTPQPNAFATGRSPANAAVCASTGLLDMLSPEEVAGVMAHELAHIKSRDTLTMTVAASIAGAISMLAQYGLIFGGRQDERGGRLGGLGLIIAAIAAPFAAMLVQMAISRSREYQADLMGARICGQPLWLASALRKIHSAVARIRNPAAEAVPATAHMFIINPLTGRGFDSIFTTHPATENRVAELEALAKDPTFSAEVRPLDLGATARQAENTTDPWAAPREPRGPWG